MANEQRVFNLGFVESAADLTAKQFRCVKVTADFAINIATAAGAAVLGVLQNKPNTGEVADVAVIGVTKIVAGAGDLAAGAFWQSAADGSGITASTADVAMGVVLKGAAAGELATVTVGCGASNQTN